ncbi:MAG TPA: hypothetical protein PLG67_01055 [Bacillota bacterium]|jgi:hypothetical protein|nr:hypothetical protein [Bacillota bacterium]HRS21995.1 hypothetical protein [Clostridia bacterium]HQE65395.1 hypothetical protein [Bacillota bacterium]HQI16101.1 hypothetical protein [Bacillota bacterium]HQJ37202.1 hypothetical protein [Bacillota bacterium]
MRNLSDAEVLSLTGLLKMEQDSLTVSRALHSLISNDELKKQSEAGMLAAEGRIKGIQQFIAENGVTNIQEVQ